jgi:hypothetical protein
MSKDLCYAVWNQDFERVIACLERGDDINFADESSAVQTPLNAAITQGNSRIAEIQRFPLL